MKEEEEELGKEEEELGKEEEKKEASAQSDLLYWPVNRRWYQFSTNVQI